MYVCGGGLFQTERTMCVKALGSERIGFVLLKQDLGGWDSEQEAEVSGKNGQ